MSDQEFFEKVKAYAESLGCSGAEIEQDRGGTRLNVYPPWNPCPVKSTNNILTADEIMKEVLDKTPKV